MRRRILLAFEAAERATDPGARRAWLTFVIVGGGPTGVELAGTLGEIARHTLRGDFRGIDPAEARILLVEGDERVLPPFPPPLSEKAAAALGRLGVTVRAASLVTAVDRGGVTVKRGEEVERVPARTVLWAAGVRASSFGRILAERTGAPRDRAGRLAVEPDLSLPSHPEILVIGDLARVGLEGGRTLPGVAPVAIQAGRYAAELIRRRLAGRAAPPFRYRDRGSLATIGRHAAVADFGRLRFGGTLAWFLWLFVHLMQLVGYENKVLVLVQWAWSYVTWNRGARLITGESPFPLEGDQERQDG